MLAPAEKGRPLHGVIDAYALKGAAAIVQRMGEHVHLRLVPGNDLAIHPNKVSSHRHKNLLLAPGGCRMCTGLCGKNKTVSRAIIAQNAGEA